MLFLGVTGDLDLTDYSSRCTAETDDVCSKIQLDERSKYAIVSDNNGKEKVVRKSAVCYMLSRNKYKLSSDRLQRVKEKEYETGNKNSSKLNTTTRL